MSLSKLSKALKLSSSLSTGRGRIVHNGEGALRFRSRPFAVRAMEQILAEQSRRMIMQPGAVIRRCASTSRVTSRELVQHEDDCIIPLYGA